MTVACCRCTKFRIHFTMRKVVELSRPVDISSKKRVVLGPTTISPAERQDQWWDEPLLKQAQAADTHIQAIAFQRILS